MVSSDKINILNRRLTASLSKLTVDFMGLLDADDEAYQRLQSGQLPYAQYYKEFRLPADEVQKKLENIGDILDIYLDDLLNDL